jgi:hypothetical protein
MLACTIAFYATEQQSNSPFEVPGKVAPHDFCKAPNAIVHNSGLHFVHRTTLQNGTE